MVFFYAGTGSTYPGFWLNYFFGNVLTGALLLLLLLLLLPDELLLLLLELLVSNDLVRDELSSLTEDSLEPEKTFLIRLPTALPLLAGFAGKVRTGALEDWPAVFVPSTEVEGVTGFL